MIKNLIIKIIDKAKRFDKRSPVHWVMLMSGVLMIAGLLFYSNAQTKEDVYVVNIDGDNGNYFVDKDEVVRLIEQIRYKNPYTMGLKNLNLKALEDSLRLIDFVQDAQVSRDLKGNLVIDIQQDQPIARLLGDSGKGGYINQDRDLLDLSDSYSARVVVVTGVGADSLLNPHFLDSVEGQKICDFIAHVNSDPLWKAMIAQVDIDQQMEMTLYTQIGKQSFQFGRADEVEKKLKKMKLFFDEIAPKKGWKLLQYGKAPIRRADCL